jgi:hypothetical protein
LLLPEYVAVIVFDPAARLLVAILAVVPLMLAVPMEEPLL